MPHRIIYCMAQCMLALMGSPHERLADVEGGLALSMADAQLSKMIADGIPFSLLYFSPEDYHRAIRDLLPPERNEVLHKRLNLWSPGAMDEGFDWIYRGQRRSLCYIALSDVDRNPELSRYFESGIRVLAGITGEGRYTNLSMIELLIAALEGEVRLMEEAADAEVAAKRRGSPRDIQNIVEFRQRHSRCAIGIQNLLDTLGESDLSQSLPYYEISRVWFAEPMDDDLKTFLRIRRRPYFLWHNGAVTEAGPREVEALMRGPRSLSLVYLSAGGFLEDLQHLTPAQLKRDFGARISRFQDQSMVEYWRHLHTIHLDQLVYKHNIAGISTQEKVTAALKEQVLGDTETLKTSLLRNPSWIEPTAVETPFQGLIEQENALRDDSEMFRLISKAAGRERLEKRFAEFQAAKESDLVRLKKIPISAEK